MVKTKPAVVKSNTYIDSSKEINNKDPKFKIGDLVRISKYKNIFAKGYTPIWSGDGFMIIKVKNTMSWTYVLMTLMDKNFLEHFTKKNCWKQIKKSLGNKLYVK